MTLADLLNAPAEIEFKGRVFRLRQPTQIEQAQFQRWLEDRAKAAVGRATDLPDDLQRQAIRETVADIAAGTYEWGGEVCARALRTPVGIAKIVQLVLADQGVTFEMAQQMVEQQLREIAAVLVSKATHDPKALAAALNRLGLPSDFCSPKSSTRRSTARSKKSRG